METAVAPLRTSLQSMLEADCFFFVFLFARDVREIIDEEEG